MTTDNSGWRSLWAAVKPSLEDHPVEPGTLGEYALLRQQRGQAAADSAFPSVSEHLRLGCERCDADLRDFPFDFEPSDSFERVRRVIATLFSPGSLAQAWRGDSADVRTYRANGFTIALSVSSGSLEGILTPAAPATVQLSAPGLTLTADVDALGNFAFDDIARGTYELTVLTPEAVIVVERLVLDTN